jgi:hypothetical protein
MVEIIYPSHPDFKNIFKEVDGKIVRYCLPDGRKTTNLDELKDILTQEYQNEIVFLYLYEKTIKEVMEKFKFTQEDAENAISYNLRRYNSHVDISSATIFPSTFSPTLG